MKIRADFVSNSSSSSFVLWGVNFDTGELVEKLRGAGLFPPPGGEEEGDYERLEAFLEKIPYENYVWSYDDNFVAFGLSPDEMKEDETLKGFKARVVETLKSYGVPVGGPSEIEFIKGVDADGSVSVD